MTKIEPIMATIPPALWGIDLKRKKKKQKLIRKGKRKKGCEW